MLQNKELTQDLKPLNMLERPINLSNLEKSFDEIAKDLFNHYVLCVDEKQYQLTEIEFYCNNYEKEPSKKLDNFAHKYDDNYSN